MQRVTLKKGEVIKSREHGNVRLGEDVEGEAVSHSELMSEASNRRWLKAGADGRKKQGEILKLAREKSGGKTEGNQSRCPKEHRCFCGIGASTPHLVGEDGCPREMAEPPLLVGLEAPSCNSRWMVEGNEITDYTLRYQRGYYQHFCGCWSKGAM